MTRQQSLLVVDDNEIDREAVVRALKGHYRVAEADSAEHGLQLFEQVRPDCVLLDYRLPDAEGIDVLRELVRGGGAVVVFTGQGNQKLAVEAMKEGALDYLVKEALDSKVLLLAVRSAIERSSLRRDLAASESRTEALLRTIPDAIVRLDRDGQYLDLLGAADGYPFPRDQIVGRNVRELLPPEMAERVLAAIHDALDGGGTGTAEVELEGPPKRWLESRCSRYGEDEVVFIVRNQTERHNLEERMRTAQRMEAVGRLAGGVAHDFNNMLTVIQGYASLLIDDLHENDPARADIQVIIDATKRSSGLVSQLLTFSRKQVRSLEIVNLGAVVGELEKMLRRVIGEHVRLESESCSDLGSVEADATQVEQVIMNLVVNARDAMPRGGKIKLRTRNVDVDEASDANSVSPGRYVSLAVSDTGDGMDAETQSRIFEPFFSTKSEGHGTGLGLSTVYGIVTQSDGHIQVDSTVGRGTTFEILLPRTDERPSTVTILPARVPAQGHETILLVEDDPIVSLACQRTLKKQGYDVLAATHAGDAILACETSSKSIDLMLTDVILPHIDGLELYDRLATSQPDMRVAFMSGYAENDAIERLSRSEAVFLQKPFTPSALIEAVREALSHPPAPRTRSSATLGA